MKRKKSQEVEEVPDQEEEQEDFEENGMNGEFDEEDFSGNEINEENDGDEGADISQFMKSNDEKSDSLITKEKTRAPTSEEVIHILETEQYFKSNMFKLELEELFTEVKVNYDKLEPVEKTLHWLKGVIDNFPEEEITGTDEDFPEVYLSNADVSSLKLRYKKPKSIDIVGSFLLKTQVKPVLNIDVAIKIPNACFKEKDILNYRYYDKRALYIHHIALKLKKHKEITNISFTNFLGDKYKPILVLEHKDSNLNHVPFHIRLFPTLDSAVFKLGKLVPSHNNVRSQDSSEDSLSQPTPFYNSGIVEDMLFFDHLKFIHSYISASPVLVDVSVMLKVWCRKRNMNSVDDSFNGFLLSMFLIHLISSNKISSQLSSFHIFKLVMQHLAGNELSQGIFMKSPNPMIEVNEELRTDFLEKFQVVFVDPSGLFNLAHRVSKFALEELQKEAKISFEILNDQRFDGFDVLFLHKKDFYASHDYFIQIDLPSEMENVPLGLPWEQFQRQEILQLIKKALSDRVTGIRNLPTENPVWKLKQKNPTKETNDRKLIIGFDINTVRARSVIDIGPPADEQDEAKQFKEFWGEKAEIRRFKDGKIVMAALWELPEFQKPLILYRIVQFVLNRHFHMENSRIFHIGTQLESLLYLPSDDQKIDTTPHVVAVYDKLAKQIRELSDLPLTVMNLQPISPCLRYTSVFSPIANKETDPMKVILQFEGSSSWPDSIKALRKIKSAFYLKIANSLSSNHGLRCKATHQYVEVESSGYYFRIFIFVQKEISLLENSESTKSLALLLKEENVHRPIHASTLHNFHLRYVAFGPTVRLVLRWLHSHLFSGYFTIESIELLVAYLFCFSRPFQPPATPMIGFYRFLHLLATFDFQNVPIIVDFDNEFTREDVDMIQKKFDHVRKQSPNNFGIFIATPKDRESMMWTKMKPSKLILKRMIAFAKISEKLLREQFENFSDDRDLRMRLIFKPSLQDYHVIIQLRKEVIPSQERNIEVAIATAPDIRRYKSKKPKTLVPILGRNMPGFHPVECYVNELKMRFGSKALIFYDELGGDVVAVVWKPDSMKPIPLKVVNSTFMKPNAKEEGKVSLNVTQILYEMRLLGEGLVAEVRENKK